MFDAADLALPGVPHDPTDEPSLIVASIEERLAAGWRPEQTALVAA